MVRKRTKRAALALYVALIPITMRHVGREAVRITTAMAWKALTLKRRQPKWGAKQPRVLPPETDPPQPSTDAVPVELLTVRRAAS
jgi:hypothetical protein